MPRLLAKGLHYENHQWDDDNRDNNGEQACTHPKDGQQKRLPQDVEREV